MKFVDLKCPVCGKVEEYSRSLLENTHIMCNGKFDTDGDFIFGHHPVEMERVFSFGSYRVVNYSPEYKGGCDKNLYNQPDALGNRK